MKLFEKIRRFIRGADRAVTNAICERLDNTAEKLENFARSLDPEAFQESKMRESWEGRPKTDPETAARLAQMSVTSLEDAIDQITEGMVKVGFRADEAADAIRSAISAGLKPKPLSHLTNNWRKMHGLPMHRKPASFRRRRKTTGGILLMPMKKNIPKGHPEWSLVKCPICGQECWRPISRQELRQKKMQAACTECGLKIESRRNQP